MTRTHLVLALTSLLSACTAEVAQWRPSPPVVDRDCRIGLLRRGSDPGRPYRVLGEVQADDDALSTREASLGKAACSLGAQAVIDVREVLEPNGNNFGRAESDKSWPGQNEGRAATAGRAVVFTDGQGAPQPPEPGPAKYVFPG